MLFSLQFNFSTKQKNQLAFRRNENPPFGFVYHYSIKTIIFFGATSRELRRVLFSCYLLPIFTWLFPIFPLFSDYQRVFLSKFYYTCLKRVLHIHQWSNLLFAFTKNEISLESRCRRYWIKYLKTLNSSTDGDFLLEQLILNSHKESWWRGEQRMWYLRLSKRISSHDSVIEKCFSWYEDNPLVDSTLQFQYDDIELSNTFPETS